MSYLLLLTLPACASIRVRLRMHACTHAVCITCVQVCARCACAPACMRACMAVSMLLAPHPKLYGMPAPCSFSTSVRSASKSSSSAMYDAEPAQPCTMPAGIPCARLRHAVAAHTRHLREASSATARLAPNACRSPAVLAWVAAAALRIRLGRTRVHIPWMALCCVKSGACAIGWTAMGWKGAVYGTAKDIATE